MLVSDNSKTFNISAVETSTFELAVLRTELSNSVTLLSHVQGSVALLISAIGVAKFLDSFWLFDLCGVGLVVASIAVLFRGTRLFRRTNFKIRDEKERARLAFAPFIPSTGGSMN
jgi:uncharacterized membrane protein YidH (DUF202 family)